MKELNSGSLTKRNASQNFTIFELRKSCHI